MILWSLWMNRNNAVWNQKMNDTHFILSRARYALNEWQMANQMDKQHRGEVSEVFWKALIMGHYKCNVDVSVQPNGNFGFGMIVQNNSSLCCAGKLIV